MENLRLMKQLNIALNREIYRVRRVAFFNNVDDSGMREVLEYDFPRVEIFEDREKQLHFMLDKLGSEEIVNRSYIFVLINHLIANLFIFSIVIINYLIRNIVNHG